MVTWELFEIMYLVYIYMGWVAVTTASHLLQLIVTAKLFNYPPFPMHECLCSSCLP